MRRTTKKKMAADTRQLKEDIMRILGPLGASWDRKQVDAQGRARWDLRYRDTMLGAVLSDGAFYPNAPTGGTLRDWKAAVRFLVAWDTKYYEGKITQMRELIRDLAVIDAALAPIDAPATDNA